MFAVAAVYRLPFELQRNTIHFLFIFFSCARDGLRNRENDDGWPGHSKTRAAAIGDWCPRDLCRVPSLEGESGSLPHAVSGGKRLRGDTACQKNCHRLRDRLVSSLNRHRIHQSLRIRSPGSPLVISVSLYFAFVFSGRT